MSTILITGAASGLGRGFLEHYACSSACTIIAIDRDSNALTEALASNDRSRRSQARIIPLPLDLTDETLVGTSIDSLRRRDGVSRVDIVLHCAGVRGLVPGIETCDPESVARAETLQAMDAATMRTALDINCIATFLLLRALVPLLVPEDKDTLAAAERDHPIAKVVVMSSRMGSISSNVNGGAYAYRASKAALNAVIKSLSVDVADVVWLAVHPGRVDTKLVKSDEPGAISVEEAVRSVIEILERLEKSDSGRFVDKWGKDIPW